MSCPACFSGGTTLSLPTGIETTLHGLPTYVSSPPAGTTPKGLILFITDAFGWKFANNRVLCDQYALKGGYLVYCPDFMDGKAMDPIVLGIMDKIEAAAAKGETPAPELMKELYSHALPWKTATDPAKTYPGVVGFVKALRMETGDGEGGLQVGVAGFCWGGKHAFMLAAEEEGLVDAVFTAHPSYIVTGDVGGVRVPMSVAVGDKDVQMKMPQVEEMKKVLEKGDGKGEVVVYGGAKHGFAIRTHPEDEVEMRSAGEAEEQALEWFGRWIG